MSQKSRKKKTGRPKGLPKTGGRKPGTPNKKNVRVRDMFAMQGFEFAEEFIKVYDDLGAADKMGCLLRMAPFFMQRLREEGELTPTPDPNPDEQGLRELPTSALLSQLPLTPAKPSH